MITILLPLFISLKNLASSYPLEYKSLVVSAIRDIPLTLKIKIKTKDTKSSFLFLNLSIKTINVNQIIALDGIKYL